MVPEHLLVVGVGTQWKISLFNLRADQGDKLYSHELRYLFLDILINVKPVKLGFNLRKTKVPFLDLLQMFYLRMNQDAADNAS